MQILYYMEFLIIEVLNHKHIQKHSISRKKYQTSLKQQQQQHQTIPKTLIHTPPPKTKETFLTLQNRTLKTKIFALQYSSQNTFHHF